VVWVAVDIIYVPMFLHQGLFATAGLYAVFLALAVLGFRDWSRSVYVQRAGS
jgi:nicotinamide mononucleotide transporter